jgi:hypothetical protein
MFRHEFAPAHLDQKATKSADFVRPDDPEEAPYWANEGLEAGNESTAANPRNNPLPAELRDFVPFDEGASPTKKELRNATRETKALDKKTRAEAEAAELTEAQRIEDEFVASVRNYKNMQGLDQGIRNDQKEAERKSMNSARFKTGVEAVKRTVNGAARAVAMDSPFIAPLLEASDDRKRRAAAQEAKIEAAAKKAPKNPSAAGSGDAQTMANLKEYRRVEALEQVRREKEAAQEAAEKQAKKAARIEASREKAKNKAEKQTGTNRLTRKIGHAGLVALGVGILSWRAIKKKIPTTLRNK